MSLIVFACVVLLVTILLMWAIWYMPLPPTAPPHLKNIFMVILLVIAALVIASRAGLFAGL